ncbi:MAG: hypothetical protein RSC08_04840, partial [Oscillospiraceae bacterium]
MKAIIVEVKAQFAAALSDDGSVVKVKNQNYMIGQVIEMTKETSTRTKLVSRIALAAACCALVLVGGAYSYLAPASYVSMDVNPSIEYTLNMFDRVLSVNAVNEDGAHILQEVNLKDFNNKTIDEAIKLTLAEIDKEGYFDGNAEGGIVIATSGKDTKKAEKLAENIGVIVKKQCDDAKKVVKVQTVAADQKMVDEAKTLGVTPGKLALIRELQEEYKGTEPFDTKAWMAKPVKEIMAETQRLDVIGDALEDAEDAAEDALDAEEDAKEDALDTADDDKDDAADAAKDAEEDAKDAAKDAEEDAKDDAEDAAEDAKEAEEDAKDAVKEADEKTKDAKKKAAEKEKEAAEKAKDQAEEAKEKEEEAKESALEAA